MDLMKKEEYFATCAGAVNKECDWFKLNQLTLAMFKGTIFFQGLMAKKYRKILAGILTKLGQNQNLRLQGMSEECQRTINLWLNWRQIMGRHTS